MSRDQDFGSELDDYVDSSKSPLDHKQEETWEFDEQIGVYVIHSKRLVMYYSDDSWVCGDYEQVYNNDRYVYDDLKQAWLDIATNEYSIYDQTTHSYVQLTDSYWQGHPQSTNSIRLVIQSSPHFQSGQVALIDETGLTIGRDRSWNDRLRLPEMIVSKYHCTIYFDKQEKLFYIIDNGSQHGTFVNEKRLSEPKQSSRPYSLRHNDILRVGSTSLQVHVHDNGWPCQSCVAAEFIKTRHEEKSSKIVAQKTLQQPESMEQSRREWVKNAKKMYLDDFEQKEYIDRAKIRRQNTKPEKFVKPCDEQSIEIDTTSYTPPITYNTPVQGVGSKMLQKLGWQEGQSLGKRGDGILEPVKPSFQSGKSGLGVNQRFNTEVIPNESKKEMQWRLAQQRYNNI